MSGSSTEADKKHFITILLAFAAVYFIWGTTYLGIRVAIETIPPFFMAGSRVLTAGTIMFIFLRARGAPRPTRLQWRSAVIAGALLLGGGSGLVAWAEQQVPSGTAALIVATVPLWIALFEWLIFRGGRPGKHIRGRPHVSGNQDGLPHVPIAFCQGWMPGPECAGRALTMHAQSPQRSIDEMLFLLGDIVADIVKQVHP